MKTTDVTTGCIIPVRTLEVDSKVYADETDGELMYDELEKIGVDLNNCSWVTVSVERKLSDMGFVDTEFDEKYSDWYAINLIHDSDGRMERVVVLELKADRS